LAAASGSRWTKSGLWLRWVGANSLAELVGLGATFALDILILTQVAAIGTALASLVGIVLLAATGAIEGAVVGVLQWSVLRRPFPAIARRAWVTATVIGAVIAWFLGSLPSTLMDMGSQQTDAAAQEPPFLVIMLLAAGMGLVLGAVLATPQYRVLSKAVQGAWIWIPANCLAWALGMPVIFASVDRAYAAYEAGSIAGTLLIFAVALALAGAVVGAVHGVALVKLAGNAKASFKTEMA
jgi:hypothetical protein